MGVSFLIANKNATKSSISIDIAIDGARIRLRTGYQIDTEHWDAKKCFVKSYAGKTTTTGVIRALKELELSILDLIEQYRFGKPRLSFIELEEKLNGLIDNPRTKFNKQKKSGVRLSGDSLLTFFDLFIKDCETGVRLSPKKKKLKPSTLNSFRTSRKMLNNFFNTKSWDLKLGELTQEHIDLISDYLIQDLEWSMNTHAKLMMDMLQMVKYAVKLKRLPPAALIELKFDTSREETDSIYLTENEILELLEIKDFDNAEQEIVRDVFAIGCFTAMRFSDYSVLDPTAIRNNRLAFIQVKTGAKVTIPIHPVVNTILQKYDYKLPPVPRNNDFNAIIKKVGAKMPCLHVPFTKQITYKRELTEIVKMKYDYLMTHTARRSFCSNEFIKGTDPMIIMAISGHKSYKSFMRYIKVSGDQFADKMEKIWQDREAKGN
jgi:site-specific recombinase XerD